MDNKPYVFISYAHLDSNLVLPCVHAMKRSGINLWYDEGIEAGSEWPEFIAEKVVSCTKFVLFISNAYLNSQNCKRELNFAISRKKDILSIFIDDVNLSPGMEMQLGTYQAIYSKRFKNIEMFQESLCRERFFDSCRINKTHSEVSQEQISSIKKPAVNAYGGSQSSDNKNADIFDCNSAVLPNPTSSNDNYMQKTEPPAKNRIVAALLAIFLGSLGIHKFYLNKTIWGVLYIVFSWTWIPGILGLIEGIMMLRSTDEQFKEKYTSKPKIPLF